tara:strand:- start:626 stop:1006 length:381 start_codon:yes stop_codon:yes gene_type:complete
MSTYFTEGTNTSAPFRATGARTGSVAAVLHKYNEGSVGNILENLGTESQYLIYGFICAANAADPHNYAFLRNDDDTSTSSNIVLALCEGESLFFPAPILWPVNKPMYNEKAGLYLTVLYEIVAAIE